MRSHDRPTQADGEDLQRQIVDLISSHRAGRDVSLVYTVLSTMVMEQLSRISGGDVALMRSRWTEMMDLFVKTVVRRRNG